MKKNVLVILTGGTVIQTKVNGILQINKAIKKNDLLKNINKNKKELNIENIDISNLFQLDSSNITPKHWELIINEIKDNYNYYDAFVIIHGTDTLSYTCSAIAYAMTNLGKPVIFTGAQVPFGEIGSDAELNLGNAIKVAVQDGINGVLCVFGSHIMTGTRVKKISEFSYDAFENFNNDDIGIIGTNLQFNEKQVKKHISKYGNALNSKELNIISEFAMDSILVLNEFPGLDGNYLKKMIDLGVKGIVFRTYAGGNTNVGEENDTFDNLRHLYKYLEEKKIPIAVISQPAKGKTTMKEYKPGFIARSLGAIPTFDMSTEALTVKLGWLIGQNLTYEEIKKNLLTNIREEINI